MGRSTRMSQKRRFREVGSPTHTYRLDSRAEASSCPSVYGGPEGYPLLARFQDSEENYMIYRRFGEVQARLLLEAQDDVRRLETQLHSLDRIETGTDSPERLCKRSFQNKDSSPERQKLMASLKDAFKNYGTYAHFKPA